jgi:hypothetical protein
LTLSVGQISRLAGISEHRTTLRRLRAGGVRILRIGTRFAVERLALREAMPGFYNALLERLHAADE